MAYAWQNNPHCLCSLHATSMILCLLFIKTVKVELAVIITFAVHWIFLVKNENHYYGEKRYSISELM